MMFEGLLARLAASRATGAQIKAKLEANHACTIPTRPKVR